jgi:hypothetical protein
VGTIRRPPRRNGVRATGWPAAIARAAALRRLLGATAIVLLAACGAVPQVADPASDAPEGRAASSVPLKDARSYDEALESWRSAEDVNAWIGARFEYDPERAIALSETQRGRAGPIAIAAPAAFFHDPRGVCVDLARFGVETLRRIDPASKPAYLMIEFSPVSIAGNTLRRHWMASFVRDGGHYFFADSKRPGTLAGPYASTQAFIEEYAAYRGREVVAYREVDTYRRRMRTPAPRRSRVERADPAVSPNRP